MIANPRRERQERYEPGHRDQDPKHRNPSGAALSTLTLRGTLTERACRPGDATYARCRERASSAPARAGPGRRPGRRRGRRRCRVGLRRDVLRTGTGAGDPRPQRARAARRLTGAGVIKAVVLVVLALFVLRLVVAA